MGEPYEFPGKVVYRLSASQRLQKIVPSLGPGFIVDAFLFGLKEGYAATCIDDHQGKYL